VPPHATYQQSITTARKCAHSWHVGWLLHDTASTGEVDALFETFYALHAINRVPEPRGVEDNRSWPILRYFPDIHLEGRKPCPDSRDCHSRHHRETERWRSRVQISIWRPAIRTKDSSILFQSLRGQLWNTTLKHITIACIHIVPFDPQLVPWNRTLLDRPTVVQLIKKSHTFY
jgi:hypothetical protein